MHTTVIVGAGQSGLATAYYLQRQGIDPLILDDQPGPGGAWQHVWPSMTLFSPANASNLPGIPMPEHPGYPPAEHVVDYLTRYEQRYGFHIRRPVKVTHVRHTDHFALETSVGRIHAQTLVAATGTWSSPFVPYYPGSYQGEQWHTCSYPGVEPFTGATVSVVGAGNSGAQIAAELLLAGVRTTWYTRHNPRWMPDDVDGRAIFQHTAQRLRGGDSPEKIPGNIVMLPRVKEARDSGVLQATPMFRSLDEVSTDHLIWCTGFRPALTPFRDVQDAPGFHLVGYGDWVGASSATLAGVGPFAKRTAAAIAADIKNS